MGVQRGASSPTLVIVTPFDAEAGAAAPKTRRGSKERPLESVSSCAELLVLACLVVVSVTITYGCARCALHT